MPKVTSIDRKLALSPRVTAGAHKKETLEKQSTNMHLLLRSNTRSKRQHKARQRGTDLPSRAVTNKLSGVSVTHDDAARLGYGSSCLATGDQQSC